MKSYGTFGNRNERQLSIAIGAFPGPSVAWQAMTT